MSRKTEVASRHWQLLAICGALILITLALYHSAMRSEFVNYDDQGYVTENAHVQAGLSWPTVKWAFTSGEQSNWHPLTWLSHALDCQLYGLQPAGHHLTNLFFHIADSLLVFWVFRLMTGALWPSALVAALFAWHPAHVESVAWVSERKDVLSAFFWLLTMLAYIAYARNSKIQNPKTRIYYGLALLSFVLGLMSKPMLVTLPFALLLLDFWPLQRIRDLRFAIYERKESPEPKARVPIPRLIGEKIPFLVLAAAASVVTFQVQQKGGAVSSDIPLGARIANAAVSYLRYVGKLFWPKKLSVLYPHPITWPTALVVGASVFLIAVSALVLWRRREQPYLLMGWLWFLGTLVPVIGLVQVGLQSMADRYTYLPALGIFLIVAWGGAELVQHFRAPKWFPMAASGIALTGCLIVTLRQVDYWRNSGTLFARAVEVTKNNYLAYNNLGMYLSGLGKEDEAMANFQKSMEINPNYGDAQNNVGRGLARKGQLAEAIKHYEIALRIRPDLAEAHNNYGNALGEMGKPDEAIAHYLKALEIAPENENALNNLAIARAMQGKPDEAAKLLKRAIELRPSDPGAHGNMGTLLASQNHLEEAAKELDLALQLKPDDAKSQNNLGNVLVQLGKTREAVPHYEAAIKLEPNNPEANYNLGLALMNLGKRQEALKHFEEALRLRPNYAEAQKQLTALSQRQNP